MTKVINNSVTNIGHLLREFSKAMQQKWSGRRQCTQLLEHAQGVGLFPLCVDFAAHNAADVDAGNFVPGSTKIPTG
jgi:hypothetical protein